MATCFALTFQSMALDDGMAEFMTFIRGVVIVAIQMYIKKAKFVFQNFLGDQQTEMLKPFLQTTPLVNSSWSEAAVASIKGLEPLCGGELEKAYYDLVLDMAQTLLVDSFEGLWFTTLPLLPRGSILTANPA